ncbi:SUMF1/EgtB/PvdO family nonheme iron enzyme [Oleiharenicola lentus]|uniref:formylglycine-generating enzyme family protein n=1 Tax=Oleiharenicola lentus TaxID=2508720 RepID=UPI003F666247
MSYFEKEPELPDTIPTTQGKRVLIIVIVLALLGGAGGLVYWQMSGKSARSHKPPLEQAEIDKKIATLQERVQEIRQSLAQPASLASTELQRKLIEEAVVKQGELMRLRADSGNDDAVDLHEWQVQLDDLNATAWTRDSRDFEQSAEDAVRKKDLVMALERLKSALRLQIQVNASNAKQTLKNYTRQSRLQQDVERLEAEPLLNEIRIANEEAVRAVAKKQWAKAAEFYSKARVAQIKLNTDYAGTRFANVRAVEQIDAELATLGAMEYHDLVLTSLAQASDAADSGNLEKAEELLNEAATRQRMINEQYGKSRFVSMDRFEQIEVLRQTLRARRLWDEVRELDLRAAAHLQKRELLQAQKLVDEALKKVESSAQLYPKATGLDDSLKQKLSYLNLRQAELVQIQDQLYDSLAPLPGNERVALLKTEVSQALFLRVMSSNPSRNAGRLLPVDSVTYAEAEEFCRRLGWVMGVSARLPTENEMRAAAGDVRAAAKNAWSVINSSGKSQPAGQSAATALGFHDIIGNLSEWILVGEGERAVVVGGSYADSFENIEALPIKPVAKAERVRTHGLRVLVDLDLAKALAK